MILIIGKSGQVSQYLQQALSEHYQLHVTNRDELDLANPETIQPVLKWLSPDVIINPAAYTAVDAAEQESELAFKINRDAVAQIAQYCASTNTPLIHYSTDYVFAGDADKAYAEQDQTAPQGVYGQSKLEGELAVLQSSAPALILRTAWVYSNHGKNFYKTMLALSKTRNELSVVNDQHGSPTFAGSIAAVTKVLLDQVVQQGGISTEQRGIYHLTCQQQTTWSEFAKQIFALNDITEMTVNGIPSSEYPTPAKRPAFSVLNGEKLHTVFGVRLPDWQEALQQCVNQTKVLCAESTAK